MYRLLKGMDSNHDARNELESFNNSGYREPRWVKPDRDTPRRKFNASRIPALLLEEPKVIKPFVPKSDIDSYIGSVNVVPYDRAKFMVCYQDGSTVLKYTGEPLYFYEKKAAALVRFQLKKRYELEVNVCYGPIGSKGRKGQVIEIT